MAPRTKLKSGQSSMTCEGIEKKQLSAEDICKLVKVGSASGVRSIRLGGVGFDLLIEFGDKGKVGQAAFIRGTEQPASTQETEQITLQALDEEEEVIKQAALDELMIRDPAEYERRVLDGSLEDEPTREGEAADD